MAKDIEIEIKVQVENIKRISVFLKKNAKLVGTEHQIDEYFVPQHRNFISVRPTKEWLRLRESNGKFSINYKNWHFGKDGKTNDCDEYETKIEDLSPLRKIFTALDIKVITTVDKKRQIWLYRDYEVAIDEVKDLGNFVEVEYKGKDTDPKKITDQMVQFLKDMGCGRISRNYQGYPFLLLFPKEAKFENQ
jgi:adenylate cyclase, class 2